MSIIRNWKPFPIGTKLFTNVKEASLSRVNAGLENCYQNESGGFSRFPGLELFATVPGGGRVYIHNWRNDMIAVTSHGRIARLDPEANLEDVTGVPVSGGRRVTFSKTTESLLMAGGALPVRFRGEKTELLSEDAPQTTHIISLDDFVLAVEKDSGRFQHTQPGQETEWDPLDIFSASGLPDNITSMVLTPFFEILLSGPDSIEQFERASTGATPFFRRWSTGEGVSAPYTVVAADNGTWAINQVREFVRFSNQTGVPVSMDIANDLETVDDWTDAWAQLFEAFGQRFIILQAPFATNPYETKGITFLYDWRFQRWYNLYGWDAALSLPTKWPGWSYHPLWSRQFVGGDGGKIYELKDTVFNNDGEVQRQIIRTGHVDTFGKSRMDDLRLRFKRGVGPYSGTLQTVRLRTKRDNRLWSNWVSRDVGRPGHSNMMMEFGSMGIAETWQLEIEMTESAEFEVVKADVSMTAVG